MTLHADFAAETTKAIHVYANGTTGNDGNNGLVVGTPKLTLAAVFALLPAVIEHDCYVHLAGIFDEFGTVRLNKHILSGATLYISGADAWTVIDDNGGAHFATAGGTDVTQITEAVGGLVADAYKGYFAHIIDGPAAGDRKMLQINSATVLTPIQNFAVNPGVGGALFDIVAPATVLSSTAAPSTLYLNNTGGGALVVQLLTVAGTQCSIQALSQCYARSFSHISIAGSLAVPLRLKQSVVSFFGDKWDVVEGSGTFGTQLTDSHGGVGVLGDVTTFIEDVHYVCPAASTLSMLAAQNSSFNNVHYGTRFKGLAVFSNCNMINAAAFLITAGYANTQFDSSASVNALITDGSSLVFDDVDISNATTHGVQVEKAASLEMTGIVTGTGNGTFGCFVTQEGNVKITSGATPTLTGATGDITIDGTLVHATWVEIDAAHPGHAKIRHETFLSALAGGTNVHAQFGADFDTGAGMTNPDHPRNLQVVFAAAWDGGSVEATFVGPDGRTRSEVFVDPGGAGTVVGTEPVMLITRLQNLGTWGAGTVDVQLAAAADTVFGAAIRAVAAFVKLTRTIINFGGTTFVPADEAVAASVPAQGTFQPTTNPDGVTSYDIWYRTNDQPVSIRE